MQHFKAQHNAIQFVKKLPLMTFPTAATAYTSYDSDTKEMIWKKISWRAFENKNEILPLVLRLSLLPSEVRYNTLSENFGEKKHIFSTETLKDLDETTIYELFRRKALIERAICKTEHIEQFKPFLFEQSSKELYHAAKLIQRMKNLPKYLHLSKEEFIFFDKLQLHSCEYPRAIGISYYNKLTQNKLFECARNIEDKQSIKFYHALLVLESLLCTKYTAELYRITSLSSWMTDWLIPLVPIIFISERTVSALSNYRAHYPNKNLAECLQPPSMEIFLALSTFIATSMLTILAKIYLPFISYCVAAYGLGVIVVLFMSKITKEFYTLKKKSICDYLEIKQCLKDPSIQLV